MLVGSVHINLVELWELDVEVGRAERVNLLNRTRSLFAKLVTREVQNLEAVLGILLIEPYPCSQRVTPPVLHHPLP